MEDTINNWKIEGQISAPNHLNYKYEIRRLKIKKKHLKWGKQQIK